MLDIIIGKFSMFKASVSGFFKDGVGLISKKSLFSKILLNSTSVSVTGVVMMFLSNFLFLFGTNFLLEYLFDNKSFISLFFSFCFSISSLADPPLLTSFFLDLYLLSIFRFLLGTNLDCPLLSSILA